MANEQQYEPLSEAELAEMEQKLARSAEDGFMLPGTRRLIATIRASQQEVAGLKAEKERLLKLSVNAVHLADLTLYDYTSEGERYANTRSDDQSRHIATMIYDAAEEEPQG